MGLSGVLDVVLGSFGVVLSVDVVRVEEVVLFRVGLSSVFGVALGGVVVHVVGIVPGAHDTVEVVQEVDAVLVLDVMVFWSALSFCGSCARLIAARAPIPEPPCWSSTRI